MQHQRVILVGDSIRCYYGPTVIARLAGAAEVISPETIGGDSRNVLAHLARVIDRQPDLVHLNCGLHDLKREFATPERTQVPLDEYTANLRAIFSRLRAETSAVLIWRTTTPVLYARHHAVKGFDRVEDDVVAFNDAALAVARAYDLVIHDLYAFVMQVGAERLLGPDGVHFTDEGSVLLGEHVADAIRPFLR